MSKLLLDIITPNEKFLDYEADSVYLPSNDGVVNIRAQHWPTIIKLEAGKIEFSHKPQSRAEVCMIGPGFAHVYYTSDQVTRCTVVASAIESKELSKSQALQKINN